jgi:hypothetical protein
MNGPTNVKSRKKSWIEQGIRVVPSFKMRNVETQALRCTLNGLTSREGISSRMVFSTTLSELSQVSPELLMVVKKTTCVGFQ